jgi:hypothetical protein
MANKTNLTFFNAYLELDKACNQYFEISKGGATTYINRLKELEFGPDKSESLSKLIKYRKLRNIIAHEADALDDITEITKEDIAWLNDFIRLVEKKKDPISKYERRIKTYAVFRNLRLVLIGIGILFVVVLLFVILITFGIL